MKDAFGDWEVRCVRVAEGEKEDCNMFQLLRRADGNPIAEISMFLLPVGRQAVAGATIITPLGTSLPKGLQIHIEGAEPKIYPFSYCLNAGCVARAGFTGVDMGNLERSDAAKLVFTHFRSPDKPVEVNLSLDGFTDSYDLLLEDF